MVEAILIPLWVGTAFFFIMREQKEKNDRESHEWWLSELKECLHGIESEFRRRCHEIIEDAILHRKYNTDPRKQIRELKKEYMDQVYNKVSERRGQYFLKTLPNHIQREYERNLSDIEDIYRDLCYTLQEKLQ